MAGVLVSTLLLTSTPVPAFASAKDDCAPSSVTGPTTGVEHSSGPVTALPSIQPTMAGYPVDPEDYETDTDGDGLNDKTEADLGYDPCHSNPDGDSSKDEREKALGQDPLAYDLTLKEVSNAALGGAIFGDWHWGAKKIGCFNDAQIQSFPYLTGQIASGFYLIGDIRELIANIGTGDFTNAVFSAGGLVPGGGDAIKTGKTLTKFARLGTNAEKAVDKFIEASPFDKSVKKTLKETALGAPGKVLPTPLKGGPRSTYVYYGVRKDEKVYVGITNSIADKHPYKKDAVEWGNEWLKTNDKTSN